MGLFPMPMGFKSFLPQAQGLEARSYPQTRRAKFTPFGQREALFLFGQILRLVA